MRRQSREEVSRRAWIERTSDGPPLSCTVIDISPSGAKIEVDDAMQLPDEFAIRLTRSGQPNFSCKVVWRNTTAVGVRFTNTREDRGNEF